MKTYQRIVKQAGFSFLSNILIFAFAPLSIFLLTRNLTVSEYGAYALFSSFIMVLFVVLDLGFSQYIITRIAGEERLPKLKKFVSIFIFEFFLLFAFIILMFLLKNPFLSLIKLKDYPLEFGIALFIISTLTLTRLTISLLLANKEIEFESVIRFLQNSLWIILLIIFLFFFKPLNLMWIMILWFAGTFLTLLVALLYFKKEIKIFRQKLKFDSAAVKRGLLFGLPLVPATISGWLIVFIDRYLINYFMDINDVAIYALAYSLVTLILSFASTISGLLYPYAAEAYNKKQDYNLYFNMALKYGLFFIIPFTVLLLTLRYAVVTLFSGVKYIPSTFIIPFLILYPLFAYLANIYYLNLLLRGKIKTVVKAYIFAAILNIVLNLIFIPLFGLPGAAVATVTAYIILFAILAYKSKGHIKINYAYLKVERILAISVLVGVIFALINPMTAVSKILTIALGTILYILLVFLFKVLSESEINIIKSTLKLK